MADVDYQFVFLSETAVLVLEVGLSILGTQLPILEAVVSTLENGLSILETLISIREALLPQKRT